MEIVSLCACVSVKTLFPAVNQNLMMISFFSITILVAPEKPVLTKPSSQAISVGGTTSSEVCVCLI